MPLTATQQARVRTELARVAPQLGRLAPVERQQRIRDALERAGVVLTWAEWEALAPGLLGDLPHQAEGSSAERSAH